MIKKILLSAFLVLTSATQALGQNLALDFVPQSKLAQKVECKLNKNHVEFAGLKSAYRLYDKHISDIKIVNCEKIAINTQIFFTVTYSTTINELSSSQKVLIYEVVLANHKSKLPQTVRSEIVDQLDLSGDPAHNTFQNSLQAQWGLHKTDKSILLKLNIVNKNEKPFPYYLKYNTKSLWFENIF